MDDVVNSIVSQGYIPVGTRLSREQAAAIPFEFFSNRTLLDPRYAGFDPDFKWDAYVDMQVSDPVFERQVRGALDQFSRTEKGQHLIRQAFAMEAIRDQETREALGKAADQYPEFSNPRILITQQLSNGTRASASAFMEGRLTLASEEIRTKEILTVNGSYMEMTIQHVLFHELGHAADGFNRDDNKQAYMLTHGRIAIDPKNAAAMNETHIKSAIEYATMRNTTEYMGAHYNEPERHPHYSTPFRNDATGAGTHFFESMLDTKEIAAPLSTTGGSAAPDKTVQR